jgi:ribosomal protein S18 acetylase RimI-like enzyme
MPGCGAGAGGGGGAGGGRARGGGPPRPRAAGSRRMVLEVSSGHEAAVRLYRREGFTVVDERRSDDPATGRGLHYLHLARELGNLR